MVVGFACRSPRGAAAGEIIVRYVRLDPRPPGSWREQWHAFVGGCYLELADAHWRWGTNRATWWERLLLATVGVRRDRDGGGHGPAANVRAVAFRAHLRAAFRDAWPRGLIRVIKRTDRRKLRLALRTWPAELIFVFRDPTLVGELERSGGFLRVFGLRPRIVHREERDGLVCIWLWPGFPRRGERRPWPVRGIDPW